MRTKQWAIAGVVAAIVLTIWTTAFAAGRPTSGQQRQDQGVATDARDSIPGSEELVRLEDSLQWTGRDAIELPVSLFVTDLLPVNC